MDSTQKKYKGHAAYVIDKFHKTQMSNYACEQDVRKLQPTVGGVVSNVNDSCFTMQRGTKLTASLRAKQLSDGCIKDASG